jgi:hypothetical protein
MHHAIVKDLRLRDIRLDRRAQPRASSIDEQVADEYARDLRASGVLRKISDGRSVRYLRTRNGDVGLTMKSPRSAVCRDA